MSKADLYGGASLRRLRGIAPSQDRADPMFQPVAVPAHTARNPPLPVTLGMLDAVSGRYAAAARAEAQWIAITDWLGAVKDADLPNPVSLSLSSVEFVREADRYRLGYPNQTDTPDEIPVLDGLKIETQRGLAEVAKETFAAWEAAGCPCLTHHIIRSVGRQVLRALKQNISNTDFTNKGQP